MIRHILPVKFGLRVKNNLLDYKGKIITGKMIPSIFINYFAHNHFAYLFKRLQLIFSASNTLSIFRFVSIAILLLLNASSFAQNTAKIADFIIFETPSSLFIYNKYEQQISFREQRANFAPYQPLQIEETNTLLSDNFTRAMKVRLNRDIFYLVKTENGLFENDEKLGYYKIFQNCKLLRDTVEVLRDQTIFMAKRPTYSSTTESQKTFLEKESRLLRLFTYKNFTYVQKLGIRPEFGWSSFPRTTVNKSWRILQGETTGTDSQNDLQEIVRKTKRKIDEINTLLSKLFAHFNRETNQQHPTPLWEVSISENAITCLLKNADYQTEFGESSRYLINSLENYVLGTPYAVFLQDGRIEIRKR